MKKIFGLLLVAFMAMGMCFADPVEGYWISYDEKSGEATAGWEIKAQDGKLFGTIVAVAGKPQDIKATGAKGKKYNNFSYKGDLSDLTTVGTTWIWDLVQKSEGKWEKGYIIDPNDGNRYKCRITFHAADGSKKYPVDTLEMRGEIGPFGRSQFWKSATEEEAKGLR